MPIEQFIKWNPHWSTEKLIEQMNIIIKEYNDDGYTLTLRQLYYQLVARNLIKENSIRVYKSIVSMITNARKAGLVDWESIEDRNRTFEQYYVQEDIDDVVRRLWYDIQFDRWEPQPNYVEVWVEKEALGNVVKRACGHRKVPYLATKGYLSASEAWRAGKRFEWNLSEGKKCYLIHLGDHDPSGVDMTRDNQDRIDMFSNVPGGVKVNRIALNMPQVKRYKPPPNPAKITDTRAKAYIKKYGKTSWELDALEPKVIENLIVKAVDKLVDEKIYKKTMAQEKENQQIFKTLDRHWPVAKQMLLRRIKKDKK